MEISCSRRCVAGIRTRDAFGVEPSVTRRLCQFRGDPLGARPADVAYPTELLEDPDQPRGGVDLATQYPVPRARRVGVVQVVPALAEGQDRQRPEAGAEPPGGVRVALQVGVRVVPAVVGHPLDDLALHRGRPGDRQRDPQPALRLERTMGQVPVEADRDAEPRCHVADGGDGDVGPAEPAAPGDGYGGDERQEGDHHERPEGDEDPGRLFALGQRLGSGLGRVEQGIRHRDTSRSTNYAYVTVAYGGGYASGRQATIRYRVNAPSRVV